MQHIEVATGLLEAFNAADLNPMREFLAPNWSPGDQHSDGEADRVTGRDELLNRLAAMDLRPRSTESHLCSLPWPSTSTSPSSWSRCEQSGTLGDCTTSLPTCFG